MPETIDFREHQVLAQLPVRAVVIGHHREAKSVQEWDEETLNEVVLTRERELLGYRHKHNPFWPNVRFTRRESQLGLRKSNLDDALGRSEKMLWLSRSVCKRWLAACNEENL